MNKEFTRMLIEEESSIIANTKIVKELTLRKREKQGGHLPIEQTNLSYVVDRMSRTSDKCDLAEELHRWLEYKTTRQTKVTYSQEADSIVFNYAGIKGSIVVELHVTEHVSIGGLSTLNKGDLPGEITIIDFMNSIYKDTEAQMTNCEYFMTRVANAEDRASLAVELGMEVKRVLKHTKFEFLYLPEEGKMSLRFKADTGVAALDFLCDGPTLDTVTYVQYNYEDESKDREVKALYVELLNYLNSAHMVVI